MNTYELSWVLMETFDHSWVVKSSHECLWVFMSMGPWRHECSWTLKTPYVTMVPYSWVLLSAHKCSWALIIAQVLDSTINIKCWLLVWLACSILPVSQSIFHQMFKKWSDMYLTSQRLLTFFRFLTTCWINIYFYLVRNMRSRLLLEPHWFLSNQILIKDEVMSEIWGICQV